MLLSSVSIKKPYFAFMINLAIIIFGLIAYKQLPIANNPNIDLPMVYVSINYPNASPSTVEDMILKPMEAVVKSLPRIKNMSGTARAGNASVFIEFDLEVSGDRAYEDVRAALASLTLPDNAKAPTIYRIRMDSEPIFEISVSAPNIATQVLSEIVKDNIQPRLQRIHGVSSVDLYGDRYREIHIDLNQESLKALNISPVFVKRTVENQIFNLNAGIFKESNNNFTLSVYNIPNNIDAVAKIPLAINTQKIVHLENVAQIKDTITDPVSYATINGTPSLTMAIYKESQGNVVQTAKEVNALIQTINNEYKDNISLKVIKDDSKFIQNSVNGVQLDIILGALFAVLVVFVFLHEWKNTLICMIAIPTSLIGSLALIHALHFSLNFMTLFALTLCVGIVIDDAIVVVENIHRHRNLGKSPVQAAMDGTSEIGFAAIAITLAIVSVFIPVAFMKGIIGRFFYEFGITVVVAVMISLFVSFTVVPMFSSRIKTTQKQKSQIGSNFDRKFESFQKFYIHLMQKILKFKKTTIACAVLIFIGSVALLKFVPIMFSVEGDNSLAQINFNLNQNASLDIAKMRGKEITQYIQTLPGVENVLMKIGSEQNGATNKIHFNVFLVNKNKRNFTDKEFLAYLTKGLKQFIKNSEESVGFSGDNYPLQVSLFSPKPELLQSYSNELAKYMNTLPQVSGATTSTENPMVEYQVTTNNTQATLFNVNPLDLVQTLQLLFNGSYVGKYNDSGEYFDIKMMLQKDRSHSLSDLNSVFIPTQSGSQVLLSSVAKIQKVLSSPKIDHSNGERVLTVKASYSGNDLADVTKKIQNYIKNTKPIEISNKLSGQSEDIQEMFSTVGVALILAVIFVFMVLSVQFENLVGPISILLSIPFAFSGAFIALLITRNPLSIFSMIGIIMLMGLVTKNAILLIEFAQQHRKSGHTAEQAIIEAAKTRLRPIIMTTLTMIVGMLPMAMSSGDGSEVSSNIAVTVIGGLVSSTLLTLLIIPSVYMSLTRLKHR